MRQRKFKTPKFAMSEEVSEMSGKYGKTLKCLIFNSESTDIRKFKYSNILKI